MTNRSGMAASHAATRYQKQICAQFSQSCLLFTTLCGHLFAVLAYEVILGSVELNSGVLRVVYFDGS